MSGIENGFAPPQLFIGGRGVMHCGDAKGISLPEIERAEICLTQPRGVCEHGLEHRLEFPGRAGDDPQHLRGRRLLFQRFAQIIGPPAQVANQPRVLDRDDRLVGKVLQQRNLLVGKGPHLLAKRPQVAKQHAVFEQRDAQRGSRPADVGGRHIERITLEVTSLGTQIERLGGLLGAGQRNDIGAAIGLVQPFRVEKLGVRRRTGNCREAECLALKQPKAGESRFADACGLIDDRFEHGLQLRLR